MCFSAPASFIASGGLIALGAASLTVAQRENKILALVPLLFGIQQGFEGVQWLYLNHGVTSLFAGYGFLFFAFVVWPIYVPAFVYILDRKQRKILKWFLMLGIIVSIFFLSVLLTQSVAIGELKACVNYRFNVPFKNLADMAYLAAVFCPLFASSKKIFQWFGVTIAILAVITWLFFTVTFTSVWCFFSAVVSSMFFLYLRSKKSNS